MDRHLDLEGAPGLHDIVERALADPEGAYQQYLKLSPAVASLEESHGVVSNRYRSGLCDICLAPISWLGPEPRVGGGRWVHGRFSFDEAASKRLRAPAVRTHTPQRSPGFRGSLPEPDKGSPESQHRHGAELDWYYVSPQWAERRQRYFSQHAPRCEACRSTSNIHLHHTEYTNLFDEPDEELVPLCRDCHAECHHLQRLFGWHFYNMTAEYIRYRRRLMRRVELSTTNDELRRLQERLRGR